MRKNYKRYRKSRLYIILVLLVLLATSIGYAVFTEQLDINGTISGSSNFKVYFTEATVTDSSKGTAIINDEEDTVTFTANLSYPGDKVLIGTKIKNESSMAVKLNDFTIKKLDGTSKVDIDNTADIKIDYEQLSSSAEILEANSICDYRFVIYWDSYENQTVTNPESQIFEITLNYEQNTVSPELEKVHTHASIPSGGGGEITSLWSQSGNTITNGDVTLHVGQAITGYEANGVSNWAVLGVEDGKVLLTTQTNTDRFEFLGPTLYTEGISILDNAAKNYENTIYAEEGRTRSIRVEDINRIVGYDVETDEYGSGTVFEYDNEVTFYWDGTEYPYYSMSNGLTGNTDTSHSEGFSYYDDNSKSFVTVPMSLTATETNKEEIVTVKSTYYSYSGKSLLPNDSLEYKLLFDKTASWESQGYWLANQLIDADDDGITYSLRKVGMWEVLSATGCKSYNLNEGQGAGLRPVVYLKDNVIISSEGVISTN